MHNIKILCMHLMLICSATNIYASKKSFSHTASPQKIQKTEQEKFNEDLERVGIREHADLQNSDTAAHALVQACSSTIGLYNSQAVMRYIISANKKSVNYVGNRHHSPLATIVHGVFNAPVKNVQTLLDAKAAPHDIENKHALCIVAGTHKYRTTPQAQDNAKKLSLLLMKYRYTICRDASCKYAKKFASPFLEKN